ncbi:MAG: hydrogenase maturation nickel metallochaperone HypA [Thermoplasmata archaeon HGW-Thermoplasmata-1]|nr:MAG: hydrogenase maturation nickel metallochaperone HypA [Thermoplasmata archaeon HGW-Thermoplasmata-1]
MHEFSVASSIVSSVAAEAARRGASRVTDVYLGLGELNFLCMEQLVYAIGIISEHTALEGATVHIENRPARIRCNSCGYEGGAQHEEFGEFHQSIPLLSCPSCGGSTDILEGRECEIVNATMVMEE